MDLLDRLAVLADRYPVERELGRGGMAVVYLARDLKHGRQVALKVLRPELAATLASDRFLREIRIAASLAHPHILPLFDSGETDGLLWFAMPYVEGESLRERLDREGQLPIGEAMRLTIECCGALGHAHDHGVTHRDIKPGNILLQAGHAQISDFGIAHALDAAGSGRITSGNVAIGTPTYMSPEQAGARPVDGRADLYSLGCVFYEMLAGEPPFTGRTPQAVISRHLADTPAAISVLRPTVPDALQTVLDKALAKAPADRYADAAAFANALRVIETTGGTEPQFRASRKPRRGPWLWPGALALVAVLALIVRSVFFPPRLDANRVVVFPLHATDPALRASSAGLDVALAIGAAFDHTAPLRGIDGWSRLEESERADPGVLAPGRARAITRDRGARYYIDGAITRSAGSASVIVRLYDAGADTLVAQESETGTDADTGLPALALDAMVRILPKLVEPSRASVDLSPLTDRRPGAIALAMQGDREYRRSRFRAALEFYRRAVDEDSLLAYAAVRGAQAANWTEAPGISEAEDLIALALENESLLPSHFRAFARGLSAYLAGRADEAVAQFQAALAEDVEWPEAWTALGETYYHLRPDSAYAADSLIWGSLRRAEAYDSTFTPPLFHLTEAAAVRGDVEGAARMLERMRARAADSPLLPELETLVGCARARPGTFDWDTAVREASSAAGGAATAFSVGAQNIPCAEGGFRAILAGDEIQAGERWGALLGLAGLLLAQRRDSEALAAIDSAIAGGMSGARSLYLLGDLAGAPFEARAAAAEASARAVYGDSYSGASDPYRRWLLAVWSARHGHVARLRAASAVQQEIAAAGTADDSLAAAALDAHVTLANGDTAGAITKLAALRPVSPRQVLAWGISEPLVIERALLAELLLRKKRYAEAERVAAGFDLPGPIMSLPFLPTALAVRRAAAEGLNRPDLERRFGERLAALGWDATSFPEHRRP